MRVGKSNKKAFKKIKLENEKQKKRIKNLKGIIGITKGDQSIAIELAEKEANLIVSVVAESADCSLNPIELFKWCRYSILYMSMSESWDQTINIGIDSEVGLYESSKRIFEKVISMLQLSDAHKELARAIYKHRHYDLGVTFTAFSYETALELLTPDEPKIRWV